MLLQAPYKTAVLVFRILNSYFLLHFEVYILTDIHKADERRGKQAVRGRGFIACHNLPKRHANISTICPKGRAKLGFREDVVPKNPWQESRPASSICPVFLKFLTITVNTDIHKADERRGKLGVRGELT